MRPEARENNQISPSTIGRASRAAGRHPHLASVSQEGRENANIDVGLRFIWKISAYGVHGISRASLHPKRTDQKIRTGFQWALFPRLRNRFATFACWPAPER